ncbi:MAG: hypothetical protein RJA35_525 [Actinomycetota bacterium]|jgi:pyridoxal phosphate enzyme (YggS family)
MSASNPGLAERYGLVQERIAEACRLAGRPRADVTLIVVTKFHPAKLVLDLLDLGQRYFGENKDQEAAPKAAAVAEISNLATWHFIGQLQSNKAKSVLRYAESIHSLDRDSLLQALAKERAKLEPGTAATKVFIELNLTDDPDRGGIRPDNLLPFAEKVLATDGLQLVGVMGVASLEGQEGRDFAAIQAASSRLQTLAPEAALISAGMSNDFEQALRFGATHLRIGTAITGPRQYLT